MASRIVRPVSRMEFHLDKAIVAPGRSVTVDIGGSAQHGVLEATPNILTFRNNSRFRFERPHRGHDATEGADRGSADFGESVRVNGLNSGKPSGRHLQHKSMEVKQC